MRALALILSTVSLVALCQAAFAETPEQTYNRRRELGKQRQFKTAVPRSAEPEGELIVLRVWPDPVDMRIALAALQGMTNRDKPKLYIGVDKPLKWLEYYGGKTVTKIEADVWKIFERYKDKPKGIVLYDWSIDALSNVAITYAGIEDLIPATPELAKEFQTRFGWKVVHDIRGKWKTRYEAYKWSFDNLFPKCSKVALDHYNHGFEPDTPDPLNANSDIQRTGFMVDYSVEFRLFNWHLPTDPSKQEFELAERIMQSVPFHTPIFGRSSTQDTYAEPAFVIYCAKYANLHIPAGMGSTSVLSGVQIPDEKLRQRNYPVRALDRTKIYIAFTNSEHDNLEHVIGGGPPWQRLGFETDDPYRIWWCDPLRGKIPIGWPIGPLVADLAPSTMAHFANTATQNDYFLAALSGLCLSEPEAYGEAYPEHQDALLDEYCRMTGDYMRRLNWTQLQPVGTPAILRHFVKEIPEITGMMEGYGPKKGMNYPKANCLVDGVPVFYALTEGTFGTSRERTISSEYARKSKALAEQIQAISVADRPAFMHIWTVGWDFGPTTLKMTADLLPPHYEVVRPDELASLYKQSEAARELKRADPKLIPSGTVNETPDGDSGLIVDTGKIKVQLAWGNTPVPAVQRIMGVDGKWRGAGMLTAYNPRDLQYKSMTCTKTKDLAAEKEYLLKYVFATGERLAFTVRAIAGQPFVIVKEECWGMDIPSWGFDIRTDFVPDQLRTDDSNKTLDYRDDSAKGSLPFYRWMLACKDKGPDRDLIGFMTYSFSDWTSGSVLLWQRKDRGFWEFYHTRSGMKQFAIVALDRTEVDAPAKLWTLLNE